MLQGYYRDQKPLKKKFRTPSKGTLQQALQLSGADTLLTETGKEYRLKEAIERIKDLYDYVIIDTPPALGIITINALTACNGIIIPAGADIYSSQGISQLKGTIETVKKY